MSGSGQNVNRLRADALNGGKWPFLRTVRGGAPGFFLLGLAVTAMLGFGEHYSDLFYRSAVDDALISMQYAKNLVLGNGLVFNVGERVEGYTNFLWVVLMAPLYALSSATDIDFILLVTRVNVAIAALTLVLVHAIGKQLWGNNLAAMLIALGLCVVDNSYVVWATLGLEGHLLALFMLLAFWLAGSRIKSRGVWIGLALAAAHMTRPDSGLFNAFLIAGLGAAWLVARSGKLPVEEQKERLRVLLIASATWALVYGSYFGWRYQYYGWFFPNTYYVKVGAGDFNGWERGFTYVAGFVNERSWLPVLALLGLLAPTTSVARSVVVYLAAHAVYVASVGGDYFAGHRFFVPQIPLFAISLGLAAHALSVWITKKSAGSSFDRRPQLRLGVALLASSAVVVALWQLYEAGRETGPLQGEIMARRGLARIHRNFMHWLSLHKPHDASYATCAIGSAGFDADFERVIDTCGTIDPIVAHQPVENFGHGVPGHEKHATTAEVLAQKPTYIDRQGSLIDYWPHGYYFDASMRLELLKTVEGIWRRDELLERGAYLTQHAWHFDPGQSAGWTAEGSAFQHFPTLARSRKQYRGIGELGPHINSFSDTLGDIPTGRLMSPEFELLGDKIVLRVGGGYDPEHLRVALWVDGKPVLSATGVDSEHLSRREWNIAPYRGKQAKLEILDDSSGPRGHIMVDEVVQWVNRRL